MSHFRPHSWPPTQVLRLGPRRFGAAVRDLPTGCRSPDTLPSLPAERRSSASRATGIGRIIAQPCRCSGNQDFMFPIDAILFRWIVFRDFVFLEHEWNRFVRSRIEQHSVCVTVRIACAESNRSEPFLQFYSPRIILPMLQRLSLEYHHQRFGKVGNIS